jgi:NTE family protein
LIDDLAAYGCPTRMHVVRLLAPRFDHENHTKDVDFSRSGIRMRWDAGYADTLRALERKAWQDAYDPLEGIILHEMAPEIAVEARAMLPKSTNGQALLSA